MSQTFMFFNFIIFSIIITNSLAQLRRNTGIYLGTEGNYNGWPDKLLIPSVKIPNQELLKGEEYNQGWTVFNFTSTQYSDDHCFVVSFNTGGYISKFHNLYITYRLFKRFGRQRPPYFLVFQNNTKGLLMTDSAIPELGWASFTFQRIDRFYYNVSPFYTLNKVERGWLAIYGPPLPENPNDLMIQFFGKIKPFAFQEGAFEFPNTTQPVYLQFDLVNADTALNILPIEVFGAIFGKSATNRSSRAAKQISKFDTNKYKPFRDMWQALPYRDTDTCGNKPIDKCDPDSLGASPAITSPSYNRFTVHCNDTRNYWLSEFILAKQNVTNPIVRLGFNCEDGRDVNDYVPWGGGGSRTRRPVTYPEIVTPVGEGSDINWLWYLLAVILLILLLALIAYFILFRNKEKPEENEVSGSNYPPPLNPNLATRNVGSVDSGRTRLSGQVTRRSGSLSQHNLRKTSGPRSSGPIARSVRSSGFSRLPRSSRQSKRSTSKSSKSASKQRSASSKGSRGSGPLVTATNIGGQKTLISRRPSLRSGRRTRSA